MKYNPKTAIMSVFKRCPNVEMTTDEFFVRAREMGVFIPSAVNTHLSQLLKREELKRPSRGIYVYMEEENHEQVYVIGDKVVSKTEFFIKKHSTDGVEEEQPKLF